MHVCLQAVRGHSLQFTDDVDKNKFNHNLLLGQTETNRDRDRDGGGEENIAAHCSEKYKVCVISRMYILKKNLLQTGGK